MTDYIDSKDIKGFLGVLYNCWNIYVNNIYPYKYNLKNIKHLFFFYSAAHAIKHIK